MPARVLICRSNPLLSDPRVDKIVRALAGGGYSVQLLGWDNTGTLPLEEEQDGIRIFRRRIIVKNARGLGVIPYMLRWQAVLLGWLIKNHREIDLIHACDFDTVLPALLCKRFWDIKVVYDIFDFYADMLRATPAFLKSMIRSLDLRAMDRSDAVILADDSRREQIAGAHPRRIEVIYNSPEDLRVGMEAVPVSLLKKEGLQIAYVGNLQVERGLLELLDVLRRHPEWKLDLAGFGSDEARIIAAALELPNVTWHGRIPYQRALELDNIADVIVATYSPQIPNHRFSSPNKLFEAMMLGKPVIVARDTNVDRIVEAEECGIVVEYGSQVALEAALFQLQREPSLRQKYGKNARNAYEKTYDWANMRSRLLKLYQDLTL
jgi:glycosyltransferase involved in cell wall biosynthesis